MQFIQDITSGAAKKTIAAFIVSAAALVGLFTTVDPDTTSSIVAVVLAILNVGSVYTASNLPRA